MALRDRLCERYADRITGTVEIPAQAAVWDEFPDWVDARLRKALNGRGVARPYSHQAAAWRASARGEHLLVSTPTASGKSLCYTLPVLQSVLEARRTALYLFPTKALAHDQVAELNEINRAAALGVRAYTFDGDTPGDARRAVRTRGDIVVTNPDMLHQAILPHHTKWASFFERLGWIVVDEVHGYRGLFGSHVANVLRRLARICAFYGSRPQYIGCSATIGNPGEHAARLFGVPVTTVAASGAPRGARHLLLWNPPVVNPDLGIRASARSQSTRIARAAIRAGLRTIVFAQSRLMVEVLTKYLKDVFDHDPRRPPRVHAYRGGYLPGERRATERQLRAGAVDCVVSTSALELGVDIGALDVCILNGWPGSVASTWQRLGRAGRRQRPALGVLVAGSEPLDQYVIRHPEYFLDAGPEQARIAPDQPLVLLDHVRCAAFELPFVAGETFGGRDPGALLEFLAEQGLLQRDADRWHWVADGYPANAVNLRSVADGNFVVVDCTDGRHTVIAEVDYRSAADTLYEGAIYMVQSRPWQVERLDWTGRKAYVTRTAADYYTDAIDYQRLRVLAAFDESGGTRARAAHGEVHVLRRVSGYKKIRYYTHENIGYGPVNLPDQEMHTTAAWWTLSDAALTRAFPDRTQALDGFLGAAWALHAVAVVLAMAEPGDLGRAVGSGDGDWSVTLGPDGRGALRDGGDRALDPRALRRFEPTVFLYDDHPGGSGYSEALYARRAQLVADALALVRACACRAGCPACVGPVPVAEAQGLRPSPRAAALEVLALLAAAQAGTHEAERPRDATAGEALRREHA